MPCDSIPWVQAAEPRLGNSGGDFDEWRKFQDVVDKVKKSCEKSGNEVSNHFGGADRMVTTVGGF